MTPKEATFRLREWYEAFKHFGQGNERTVKELLEAASLIEFLEAEKDAAVDALTKIVQKHDESFCKYCNNWDRYTCPPSCWT